MSTETATPTPRPPGRPTKFCEELANKICEHLGNGVPLEYAAALCGVSAQSVYAWREKYPLFREAIQQALGRGVEERLRVIREAAKTDWRAASWWLEHVMPERFARNRIEVTGADGQPLSAGVTLYLPRKDGDRAVVETEPTEARPVLVEGNGEN